MIWKTLSGMVLEVNSKEFKQFKKRGSYKARNKEHGQG